MKTIEISQILLYSLPAFFIAVMLVIFFAYRVVRLTQKIDEYRFDKFRLDLESQIAGLSQQLVMTDTRFKQVNHLLLSGQTVLSDDLFDSRIRPNSFLQKMGIDPKTEVQNELVFVLMPFNPDFDETYHVISGVVSNVGLRCTRGDTEMAAGDILSDIIRYIVKSRLIIADITGRNPNVFYELGIAHALGKQVLIIAQATNDIPFDLSSTRVLTYEDKIDLDRRLKSWITQTLVKTV